MSESPGVCAEASSRPRANILLVDDNPDNLLVLRAILEDLGQNLVEARSGEEALVRLRLDDFAAVILDVQMPGLDGFETAKLMRAENSRHIPIIFLTAFDSDRFPVEEAYALGAVDYLVKPLSPVIVRAKVSGFVELFEKSRQIKRQADQLRTLERQKFDRSAEEQREWFRVTLSSIGDAVITTDNEGLVTFLNAVAQDLTGWSEEEAQGQPLENVFAIFNQQPRNPIENPVAKVLKEGRFIRLTNHTILVARDGTEHPIDDSASPIRDAAGKIIGVVLTFRDVTERRRLEESQRDQQSELERKVQERTAELRSSEERFRVLVEGTKDYAIFMLDPQGRIISWNPGAERIKGYRANEIIGQHFSRFYPAEDVERNKPGRELEVATAEGRCEDEGWRLRKDGSRFWASVVITALRDEAGNVRGFSKITRDITGKKQAEETARRLLQEEMARRAAEEHAHAMQEQRERLQVTLHSIGDAVIVIDADGRVSMLNPVAQALTGWKPEEASGRPLSEIFKIVNEQTRQPVENPAVRALNEGIIVGLANHTVLIAKDGTERPIDDSAAPIRDKNGAVGGGVLVFRDVTGQRRSEIDLRQSEERSRRLLEFHQAVMGNLGEGLYTVDSNGLVTYVNPAAEALFGWTSAELLGRKMHEITHYKHPDGTPLPIEECSGFQVIHKGTTLRDHDDVFIRKDGSFFPVTFSSSPLRSDGKIVGLVVVFRDNSERKRSEQTARFLADASATLATLVDYDSTLQKVASLAVPDFADWAAVDVAESDGSLRRVAVAHVDPSKVELAHELNLRYPPDPGSPQGIWNILRTGQSELVTEITDALLVQSIQNEEQLRILRELGLKSYMQVPLDVKGKTRGVITFIAAESGYRYDTKDLAVAEDLAHRAAVAIENANLYRELREADHRKDEFLAMLAHELRNPLAPIRSGLDVLSLTGDGDADTIALMQLQVEHLVRLVDDLLDVSRIIQGKVELRREPAALSAIVRRSVDAVRVAVDNQAQQLSVSMSDEAIWVNADSVRLVQVIQNLLNNASKYNDRGGQIRLSVERENGGVCISIEDNGIGIEPDLLPHVFDLFTQSSRSLDRAQGGLGIGLTLVKNLVEMHDGSVSAYSDGPGKGSRFQVHLPTVERVRTAKPESHEAPASRGRRILIVEDNVGAAKVLSTLIGRMGPHEVQMTHDGPSAVQAASTFRPEIVLLDIGLPVMDGYAVARRLRAVDAGAKMLLVAVTGYGQEEDRKKSSDAGFDEHLVKPVGIEALRGLLRHPKLANDQP